MSNAQSISTADPRWKDLYRIGGIASLLLAGLIAFAVIAYFIWPYTPGFALQKTFS
jgi:multisubunit Na+/H+ antiporter MnhB subunit